MSNFITGSYNSNNYIPSSKLYQLEVGVTEIYPIDPSDPKGYDNVRNGVTAFVTKRNGSVTTSKLLIIPWGTTEAIIGLAVTLIEPVAVKNKTGPKPKSEEQQKIQKQRQKEYQRKYYKQVTKPKRQAKKKDK